MVDRIVDYVETRAEMGFVVKAYCAWYCVTKLSIHKIILFSTFFL